MTTDPVFDLLEEVGVDDAVIDHLRERIITKKRCLQCGYEWWPNKPGHPRKCASPRCTNPTYWDRPRTRHN